MLLISVGGRLPRRLEIFIRPASSGGATLDCRVTRQRRRPEPRAPPPSAAALSLPCSRSRLRRPLRLRRHCCSFQPQVQHQQVVVDEGGSAGGLGGATDGVRTAGHQAARAAGGGPATPSGRHTLRHRLWQLQEHVVTAAAARRPPSAPSAAATAIRTTAGRDEGHRRRRGGLERTVTIGRSSCASAISESESESDSEPWLGRESEPVSKSELELELESESSGA